MDYKDLNIIHLDLDAFYASVEELDNPKLKGKPLIVGGLSNKGIVTTANYQARKYGVHSAMPIFMARQICPQATYVRPRKDRYSEVSSQVFDILYDISPMVEKVSVDEAFMDIEDLGLSPIEVTDQIREKIRKNIGISLSFGISYNKFLAKLASDWQKPAGRTIISRDMVPKILLPLEVGQVHGIGKKSQAKLNRIGIYTIEDLMGLSEEFLIQMLGKHGREVYLRIRGIDDRKVQPIRERKSIGTERTFDDTRDPKVLEAMLKSYAKELAGLMEAKSIKAKTINVKIKYQDFKTHTKSTTLDHYINTEDQIYETGLALFNELNINRPIRLLGLSASNLIDGAYEQMSLLDME